MGNMMTDGVMRSCHKTKYKQIKESRELVGVLLQYIQLRGPRKTCGYGALQLLN